MLISLWSILSILVNDLEENVDDKEDHKIATIKANQSNEFSGRTMVVATIKKQSAFQLESSADVYIHNVRKVISRPEFSLLNCQSF